MKYMFFDGYQFEADGHEEICTALWKSMKFKMYETLDDWVKGEAEMLTMIYEEPFRGDSTEHLVNDMLAKGTIKPLI